MDDDDVTVPPAGVPWVETVIGPELKISAGPYTTVADGILAVSGVAEPVEGNVTSGLGHGVTDGDPHVVAAPPKRPMLL
jgi:hypothetical protein